MKPELPNLPDSDVWSDFPGFVDDLIDAITRPDRSDAESTIELIRRFLGPGNEHVVQAMRDVAKERMTNERR